MDRVLDADRASGLVRVQAGIPLHRLTRALEIVRHTGRPMADFAPSPEPRPGRRFLVLGGVFLCVTGAEALYADMGHFGPKPIRLAWNAVVFPSLILNYAGQAALVLDGAPTDGNIFYRLCPTTLLTPLIVLATFATIIASQSMDCFAVRMPPAGLNPTAIPVCCAYSRMARVITKPTGKVAFVGSLPVEVLMKSAPAIMATTLARPTLRSVSRSPVPRITFMRLDPQACLNAATSS